MIIGIGSFGVRNKVTMCGFFMSSFTPCGLFMSLFTPCSLFMSSFTPCSLFMSSFTPCRQKRVYIRLCISRNSSPGLVRLRSRTASLLTKSIKPNCCTRLPPGPEYSNWRLYHSDYEYVLL